MTNPKIQEYAQKLAQIMQERQDLQQAIQNKTNEALKVQGVIEYLTEQEKNEEKKD